MINQARFANLWQRLGGQGDANELFASLLAAYAEPQRAGAPIPANDLCVAATAVAHGHRILVGSRDEAHFRRIRAAEVITL